jgi:hypothetical protein
MVHMYCKSYLQSPGICRLRAHVKSALSADDRTKAQIESAKTRLRIHSNITEEMRAEEAGYIRKNLKQSDIKIYMIHTNC